MKSRPASLSTSWTAATVPPLRWHHCSRHVIASILLCTCLSPFAAFCPRLPIAQLGARAGRRRNTFSHLRRASADKGDGAAYDVVILGSGPASLSLAALLSKSATPPSVAVVSRDIDKRWVPNFGCWTEEWAAVDRLYASRGVPGLMEEGVDVRWGDTECFFGEDEDGSVPFLPGEAEGNSRRTLGREYLRVSRVGVKHVFFPGHFDIGSYCRGEKAVGFDVIRQNAVGKVVNTNVFTPEGSVNFGPDGTELLLANGDKVRGRIVIDGTGAETSFTIRDHREKEGYQIAYGVEAKVEGAGVTDTHVGDYDRKKMTLFDYRSELWRDSDQLDAAKVVSEPTFNYVMPLSDENIFFEETSLVANPAMSFAECKRRLSERLASQGVKIKEVLEEEFCYIPMGGDIPRQGQRIVPVGAAAGIVHPSTGYQLARCLTSNLEVCEQILTELNDTSTFDPDAAAARIIGRTWTPQAVRQRNFAVFGGDFLMQQNVEGLKGFFSGFFKLEEELWAGFLAGWKGLPNNENHEDWFPRILFGVKFLFKLPIRIALSMVAAIVAYTLSDGLDLLQSVTPLLGEPRRFEKALDFRRAEGDMAAKKEAMEMMSSKAELPVAEKPSEANA